MVSGLITQTCDPLSARHWFNLREAVNWVVTGVLFSVCFIVLMVLFDTVLPFGGLVAGLICILAAYCLFFYVLDKRAIRIVCPHCGRYIETNTPWICGNKECGYQNNHVDAFPFIYKCERCGYYPKAYKCHHGDCRKLIFFTEDRQETGYARCATEPVLTKVKKPPVDRHAADVAKKVQNIQLKELEVKEGKLDVEIKGIKQTLEPEKPKSVEDIYRGRLQTEDDARRLRAEIDEKFKDDPDERMRRHRIVDAIMRSLL